jgi:hypothetical protein
LIHTPPPKGSEDELLWYSESACDLIRAYAALGRCNAETVGHELFYILDALAVPLQTYPEDDRPDGALFVGDNPVRLAGLTGTSVHVLAYELALQTHEAAMLAVGETTPPKLWAKKKEGRFCLYPIFWKAPQVPRAVLNRLQLQPLDETEAIDRLAVERARARRWLALQHTVITAAQAPLEEDSVPRSSSPLQMLEGGISYRGGPVVNLRGKPLAVLRALVKPRTRRLSADDLRCAVWGPNTVVGEESLRTHICKARRALREAIRAAGLTPPDDPLPTVERGAGRLAWGLDLP